MPSNPPSHQLRRLKMRESAAKKTKGHWPKGKRRNSGDPKEIKRLLDIASANRQIAEVARRLGIDRKNLYRYWSGIFAPPPGLAARISAIVE